MVFSFRKIFASKNIVLKVQTCLNSDCIKSESTGILEMWDQTEYAAYTKWSAEGIFVFKGKCFDLPQILEEFS